MRRVWNKGFIAQSASSRLLPYKSDCSLMWIAIMTKLLQTTCTNHNALFWSLSNSLTERWKGTEDTEWIRVIVSKVGKTELKKGVIYCSQAPSCLLILVYSKPFSKCITRSEWNWRLNPKQFPKCKFFPLKFIESHPSPSTTPVN